MPRCGDMRALLLTILVAACGDNLHPAPPPDARVWQQPDASVPGKPRPPTPPEPDGINPGNPVDAGVDVPAPDEEEPCHWHQTHWHCLPRHQGHL